jgi:hypothetical protein
VSQSLYAVVLSSLLACAIYAGRVFRAHSFSPYYGLVWNLLLAWVPYVCSVWIAYLHHRHPRRWWYLVLPCALWLVFFPNAPYIVTDLWHLRERPPIPMWYDIGLFVTFAWTGCFLAIVSLQDISGPGRELDICVRHSGDERIWHLPGTVSALEQLGLDLSPTQCATGCGCLAHPPTLSPSDVWLFVPVRGHLVGVLLDVHLSPTQRTSLS